MQLLATLSRTRPGIGKEEDAPLISESTAAAVACQRRQVANLSQNEGRSDLAEPTPTCPCPALALSLSAVKYLLYAHHVVAAPLAARWTCACRVGSGRVGTGCDGTCRMKTTCGTRRSRGGQNINRYSVSAQLLSPAQPRPVASQHVAVICDSDAPAPLIRSGGSVIGKQWKRRWAHRSS